MALGLHRTPRVDRRGLAAQYKLDEGRNLLKYSEDFSNSVWTKSNISFSGSKLIENTSESTHVLSYSIYVTAGVPHTWFFDIKAGGRNWARFTMYGSGVDEQAYFNVSSGTVGTKSSGVIAKIADQGSGIYRCSVTFIPVASSFTIYLFIATADNVITYTGDGASGLYVYRTQFEQFPYQVTPWTLGGTGNNLLTANQSSVETDTTGYQSYGGTTLTRDTLQQKFGIYSLKAVTPGNSPEEGLAVNAIDVTPSRLYTASAWIKGSGVVLVEIIERNSAYGYIGDTKSQLLTLTDQWQRLSVTRLFGATGVKANIYVTTRSSAPAQAITFYVDGLQIEQVNPTVSTYKQTTDQQSVIDSSVQRVNLLTPNQANGAESGSISPAVAQNGTGTATLTTVTAENGVTPPEGSRMYKFTTVGGSGYAAMYPFNDWKVGDVVSLQAWVHAYSTPTANLKMLIAYYDGVWKYVAGSVHAQPGVGKVITCENFTIPPNTTSLQVKVGQYEEGISYIDKIQFQIGSVATSWKMPPNHGQLGSTSGVRRKRSYADWRRF